MWWSCRYGNGELIGQRVSEIPSVTKVRMMGESGYLTLIFLGALPPKNVVG